MKNIFGISDGFDQGFTVGDVAFNNFYIQAFEPGQIARLANRARNGISFGYKSLR